MKFQSVVDNRKMVRTFDKREIEIEKLEAILKNMMSGPSAGFSQGTELLVLVKKSARNKFFEQWGEEEARSKYNAKWPNLENAPIIIVILANEERYRERYNQPDKTPINKETMPWWMIDAGMATMLGLLSVVDQQLVASFTAVKSQEYMREVFDIPKNIKCIGAILLGYQKGEYRPSSSVIKGKRSLNETIHYNSW